MADRAVIFKSVPLVVGARPLIAVAMADQFARASAAAVFGSVGTGGSAPIGPFPLPGTGGTPDGVLPAETAEALGGIGAGDGVAGAGGLGAAAAAGAIVKSPLYTVS